MVLEVPPGPESERPLASSELASPQGWWGAVARSSPWWMSSGLPGRRQEVSGTLDRGARTSSVLRCRRSVRLPGAAGGSGGLGPAGWRGQWWQGWTPPVVAVSCASRYSLSRGIVRAGGLGWFVDASDRANGHRDSLVFGDRRLQCWMGAEGQRPGGRVGLAAAPDTRSSAFAVRKLRKGQKVPMVSLAGSLCAGTVGVNR